MKKNDYNSMKQARDYHYQRFGGGLKHVSDDELNLVGQWLSEINMDKTTVYTDIATGTGRVLKKILTYSPQKIYAIDQSESMLKQLKLNYKQAVNKRIIETIRANSDKTPLKNRSIDIAICLHFFKHLKDIESTLKEVHRILRDDGYFIFEVLNKNSIVRFNLGSCYALNKDELLAKLNKTGFKILKVQQLHTFGETIYNLPIANVINNIDKLIQKTSLNLGTKLFVLTKKIV